MNNNKIVSDTYHPCIQYCGMHIAHVSRIHTESTEVHKDEKRNKTKQNKTDAKANVTLDMTRRLEQALLTPFVFAVAWEFSANIAYAWFKFTLAYYSRCWWRVQKCRVYFNVCLPLDFYCLMVNCCLHNTRCVCQRQNVHWHWHAADTVTDLVWAK